ncbi:MAG TPA: S8 family serine peptidase, partial [Gemmataceae bacterium]|nr:S8 family serine peptidase [Gemmataceae bacterium]
MLVLSLLRTWLRRRGQRRRPTPLPGWNARARRAFRPTLERLEERLPPGDLLGPLFSFGPSLFGPPPTQMDSTPTAPASSISSSTGSQGLSGNPFGPSFIVLAGVQTQPPATTTTTSPAPASISPASQPVFNPTIQLNAQTAGGALPAPSAPSGSTPPAGTSPTAPAGNGAGTGGTGPSGPGSPVPPPSSGTGGGGAVPGMSGGSSSNPFGFLTGAGNNPTQGGPSNPTPPTPPTTPTPPPSLPAPPTAPLPPVFPPTLPPTFSPIGTPPPPPPPSLGLYPPHVPTERGPTNGGSPTGPDNVGPSQNTGFVGSQVLTDLAANYQPSQPTAAQQREFVFDATGRVLVNVRGLNTNTDTLQNGLVNQLGMTVTGTTRDQQMVTGYLPVNQVRELPTVVDFASVTPVYAPIFSAGSVMTEGDHVIGGDTFRQKTGKDGTGVTVGVLSDSAGSLSAAQSTGDLPPSGQVFSGTPSGSSVVQVLNDGTYGSGEGRGMMEVIHDVAPGANLAFTTAEGGPQAMAAGIQTLATQARAGVIVDDVTYPDEPFFNDGLLAQTVNNTASQDNVVYLSAAGNLADHAWQTGFRGTQTMVGGQPGDFANTDPTHPTNVLQQFTLPYGQTLDLSFQWDAAFLEGGSSLRNYQVPNQVDVLVTDASGQQLIHRFGDNTMNTGEALQRVVFTNTNPNGPTTFSLAFELMSGPAPTTLKWVRFDNNAPAQFQGAATVFGHAAAANALTVGAVPWNNPTTPEPFTSQGLSTILFDANGNRLPSPSQRWKPDLAGPDGVHTATFANQNGAFFGTSAAAAHLAGSAALLRSYSPSYGYWGIVLNMDHKATDVGPKGWDSLTGFGLDPNGPPPPTIPLNGNSWSLIGPAPVANGQVPGNLAVSGRMVGIAADPTNANIIYIAAAGGGVWKSTDGGKTWAPQTDGQSTLFMGAIAVAPSAPTTVYAGTGESNNSGDSFYGRGVLKSTDGGATWSLLNNAGNFDRQVISKIAVSPTDPNTLYVAVAGGGVNGLGGQTGVWKTTDGGQTWTNTTTTIPNVTTNDAFSDVLVDPTNANIVF